MRERAVGLLPSGWGMGMARWVTLRMGMARWVTLRMGMARWVTLRMGTALRVRRPATATVAGLAACALAVGASPTLAETPISAQTPPSAQTPTVRAEVDTTVITVGDRIHLTVSVTHAPGARVAWPDSLDVAPFEVLDARVAEPAARDGRAVSTAVLTLTAFELGTLTLPAIPVTVVGAGDTMALSTDPFGIEVASVGVDESGDIRQIRGPLALPGGIVRAGFWLLVLAVAALAAWWLWRRRSKAEGPAEPTAPPKAPHEAALEALGALASSSHLMEGRVKEFHIELSDILRRYVERRFHVPALEMTTWEVTRGLQRVSAPVEFRTPLEALLRRCDLVKFAKVRPAADDARGLLEEGRALVIMTVPEQVEAPAVAAEANP